MRFLLAGLLMLALGPVAHAAADARVFKLFQAQEWKEAKALAQDFAKTHPQDAQAQFVHSVALMYNGDLIASKTLLTELTARYPRVSSPYNNLGVIYLAQGNVEQARKAFESTLRLDARHKNARKNLELMAKINGPIAVSFAHADKRGIEFLSLSSTPVIAAGDIAPAVASLAKLGASDGQRWALSPSKEEVAVNERENNLFNEDVRRQVFDALNTWAQSWAKQDVDTYLSLYSPDFEPGNGKTRKDWEKLRKERISKVKGKIRIDAVDVVLEVGSPVAVVATFQQRYRADQLNEISNKMLVFIRDSERSSQWRIVDERTSY